MVPETAFGDARAYMARPTGNTLAKPMLLKTSNPSTQPTPALWPVEDTTAAAASDSRATALSPRPIVILMGSLGSLKYLDHRRQNANAATRLETLTTESRVISHVVGIVRPKNTRFTLLGTQSM